MLSFLSCLCIVLGASLCYGIQASVSFSGFGLNVAFLSPSTPPSACVFNCQNIPSLSLTPGGSNNECSYVAPCGFDAVENKPDTARGLLRLAFVLTDHTRDAVQEAELRPLHGRKMHVTISHQDSVAAFFHSSPEDFDGLVMLNNIFWVDVWFPFGGHYDLTVSFDHTNEGPVTVTKSFSVSGPEPPAPSFDLDRGFRRAVLPSVVKDDSSLYKFFVLRSTNQLDPDLASTQSTPYFEVTMDLNDGDPIHRQQCFSISFTTRKIKQSDTPVDVVPYLSSGGYLLLVPIFGPAADESTNQMKNLQLLYGFGTDAEAKLKGCTQPPTDYPSVSSIGQAVYFNANLEQGVYAAVAQYRVVRSGSDLTKGDLITSVFHFEVFGDEFVSTPISLLDGDEVGLANANALEDFAPLVYRETKFTFADANKDSAKYFKVDMRPFCEHLPERLSCSQAIRQFSLDIVVENDSGSKKDGDNSEMIPYWAKQEVFLQTSGSDSDAESRAPSAEVVQIAPWNLRPEIYTIRATMSPRLAALVARTGITFQLRVDLRRALFLKHNMPYYLEFSSDLKDVHHVPERMSESSNEFHEYFGPSPYLKRFMFYEGKRYPKIGEISDPKNLETMQFNWTFFRATDETEIDGCSRTYTGWNRHRCLEVYFEGISSDFGMTRFPTCLAHNLESKSSIVSCEWMSRLSSVVSSAVFGAGEALARCPEDGGSVGICQRGCRKGAATGGASSILLNLLGKKTNSSVHGFTSELSDDQPTSIINNQKVLKQFAPAIAKFCNGFGKDPSDRAACHFGMGAGLVRAGVSAQEAVGVCPQIDALAKLSPDNNACILGAINEHIMGHLEMKNFDIANLLPKFCQNFRGTEYYESCYLILASGLLYVTNMDTGLAQKFCVGPVPMGTTVDPVVAGLCNVSIRSAVNDLLAEKVLSGCDPEDFYSKFTVRPVAGPEGGASVASASTASIPWTLQKDFKPVDLPAGADVQSFFTTSPFGVIDVELSESQRSATVLGSKGRGNGVSWHYIISYDPQGSTYPLRVAINDPYPETQDLEVFYPQGVPGAFSPSADGSTRPKNLVPSPPVTVNEQILRQMSLFEQTPLLFLHPWISLGIGFGFVILFTVGAVCYCRRSVDNKPVKMEI